MNGDELIEAARRDSTVVVMEPGEPGPTAGHYSPWRQTFPAVKDIRLRQIR